MLIFISCKSTAQESNPVRELPKEINSRYGIDVIPNEKTAIKIAEIILQERFINVKFNKLEPFTVNLIADGRVWDIRVVSKEKYKTSTFVVRLNKNTGEVLNLWAER